MLMERAVDVRDLYRRYGPLVYAAAHRVLREDDLAEEATTATVVRASRAALDRGDHAGFAAIAAQVVTDIDRRERGRSPACIPPTETMAEVWEARRAINSLASDEATVVRLEHVDELTHTQIAIRLGLPVATVTSISDRAHRELVRAWRTLRTS